MFDALCRNSFVTSLFNLHVEDFTEVLNLIHAYHQQIHFWAAVLFYLCLQAGGNIILRLQLENNQYSCENNSNCCDDLVKTEIRTTKFFSECSQRRRFIYIVLTAYFLRTPSSEVNYVSAPERYDPDSNRDSLR
jgi:hypothetical protein